MAVVSRIATIKFDNTASPGLSGRTFVATAAVQDTAAGSSVVITITNTATGGAADPGNPDAFTLRLLNDQGTLILGQTLSNTAASQTETFFFTNNGLSGGSARCGTIEIRLQVTKTTGGPTATYDVETDGAPNTPPALHSTTQLDRGWIRGTTTLVEDISNVGLGSAPNPPAAYDDSLYVRLTSGAISYVQRSLTVTLSHGSVSGGTNATTLQTRDATFANVCDERFAAATTTVGLTVAVPNATLTGQPDWTHTSTTDDTIDVDPRLRAAVYAQINDDSFATPPLSSPSLAPTNERLSSQSWFLFARIINARSEGVNSLSYTASLDPRGPGATVSDSSTTATRGGEAGWTGMMSWTSALPGGIWDYTIDITAPSDIDGATYLSFTNSTEFALIAINPNLTFILGAAAFTEQDDHFSPDQGALFVGSQLRDEAAGYAVVPDAAPAASINRFNFTLFRLEYLQPVTFDWVPALNCAVTVDAGTNVWTATAGSHAIADGQQVKVTLHKDATVPGGITAETVTYFARDITATTFKLSETLGGAAVDVTSAGTGLIVVAPISEAHTLGATPDPTVFATVFDTTGTGDAAWSTDDLFVSGRAVYQGAPYPSADIKEIVNSKNQHSRYGSDLGGLLGLPGKK